MNKDEPRISWIRIIKTVFHKENSLVITALSAISSALLCAIAFLYQCAILSSLNIPVSLIQSNNNKSAIYYIIFGLFFFTSTLLSQILLRFLLYNSTTRLYFHRVIKTFTKVLKRKLKQSNRERYKNRKSELARIKRNLAVAARHSFAKILLRSFIVLLTCTIPPFFIFLLVSTERLSMSATFLGIVLFLPVNILGAISQIKTILPKSLQQLIKESKKLNTYTKEELLSFLNRIDSAADEWNLTNKSKNNIGWLEQIWSTVSRADIYSAIISVIFSALLLVVLGVTLSSNKTEYWYYKDENQDAHVAVYYDGEKGKAVFKECAIINDTLYIDLNAQSYESYENKLMIHQRFKRVFRKPLPITSAYGIIKQIRAT